MSPDREIDLVLSTWLEDGPTGPPTGCSTCSPTGSPVNRSGPRGASTGGPSA